MANKELDKLRSMSVPDLNKNLETIYKEQFEDNLKLKTGQLNETHKIKQNRKQLARIKTDISEKKNIDIQEKNVVKKNIKRRDK